MSGEDMYLSIEPFTLGPNNSLLTPVLHSAGVNVYDHNKIPSEPPTSRQMTNVQFILFFGNVINQLQGSQQPK